jgi:5-methylthioadenosine/S-adenosylhomocysteine deaminase
MATTLIQGGWVVGFDGESHILIPDGVVVYEDDRITYVGRSYDGAVDTRLDARGRLVSPGLIDCHVHAAVDTQIMYLEAGRRDFFGSIGLSNAAGKGTTSSVRFSEEELRDSAEFAVSQVIRGGATTFIESGVSIGDPVLFADVAGRRGARCYIGPGYLSGRWYHDPATGTLGYDWDEAAGMAGLERARDFIKAHAGSHDGRIQGLLMPSQLDTCSLDLLRATKQVAEELGVNVQTHAAQYLYEFHEMLRRHALTPVETLAEVGLLSPRMSLAHCIFTTAHPWTHLPESEPGRHASDDLRLLAESGASAVHCPLVFARRGIAMHSFDRYRQAGVNMAIGTDTFPRDMIHEMRVASLVCKVAEGSFLAGNARDVFNAATLGGAKLLGRDDLGRLAPGAKADIIVVNFTDLHVGPTNDPIRTLVHASTGANVERVIIDGRPVVEGFRITGLDEESLLTRIQAINDKHWQALPERNWQGRSRDELFPSTFPVLAAEG